MDSINSQYKSDIAQFNSEIEKLRFELRLKTSIESLHLSKLHALESEIEISNKTIQQLNEQIIVEKSEYMKLIPESYAKVNQVIRIKLYFYLNLTSSS